LHDLVVHRHTHDLAIFDGGLILLNRPLDFVALARPTREASYAGVSAVREFHILFHIDKLYVVL
jgi:hypothetical protein